MLNDHRFRPMQRADLHDVLAIERRAYSFPWTEGIFRDTVKAGHYCPVLETADGVIVAYAVLSAAAGEADLLNITVRPERQGEGLAHHVLTHLFTWAQQRAVQNIFLEVRPSNRRAVKLYEAAGFCEVGIRPKYYPATKGREDALVMAKEL